jgi:hypothetical protein
VTIPRLKFEVAFGVPPQTTVDGIGEDPWLLGVTGFSEVGETTRLGYAGDWTDMSSRLRATPGVWWSYGRLSELDRMEAGVGSVMLDNTDRALDPANLDSPYWPYVRPMTRCRLTVVDGSTRFPVFVGFIEGWTPSWPGLTDSVVELPIVDGFKLLALARTSAAYALAASGTRVANLLDAAGWNADDRDLNAGRSDVQALAADDRYVLAAIQDAAETEDGVFYITPAGFAQFRSRDDRIVSSSQATFGDGPGELPYQDLVPSFDDERLWNDVSATPEGLTVQRAVNVSSQETYGPRWLEKNTIHTSELEAADFANWLLGRYSEPALRVDKIVLHAHANDDVLTQVLARSPGDRVTVLRRPPGGGDPIRLQVFIESVSHNVFGAEWITTWSLSPVQAEASWQLGVAGFSEAGETTRLSY